MTESEKKQSKNLLLITVVLALIVFSSVQTYYLIIMKDQLDSLQNQQASGQAPDTGVAETTTAPESSTVINDSAIAEDKGQQTADQGESLNTEQAERKQDAQKDIMAELDKRQQAPRQPRPPSRPRSPFDDDFFKGPYQPYGWDPYAEIERMEREMDRMFNETYKQLYNRPGIRRHFSSDDIMPDIDIKENRDEYIVRVNLPGADENDISVTLDGQRLTIKGRQEQKSQEQDPSGGFVFRERRSGNFRRSVTLPEPVYEGGMKTKVIDGVLTIIIPKVL